jgi:DNA-binding MarR family transcriptional regulator
MLRDTNSSLHVQSPPSDAQATANAVAEVVPVLMRQIRQEMRAAAAPRLTVAQLRALLFVSRNENTNLSALAEHLGIGLTGASGLVDRLVRDGLLLRTIDPAERRRIQLIVTPAGRARRDDAAAAARQAIATRLADLRPDQLDAIRAAMGLLRDQFTPQR